jgi:Novel STAND NTPase 1/YARHG domain
MNDPAATTLRRADVDGEHPWPGLVPFAEADSGYFFGRDEEADELYRRVRRDTITLLFGQSGLGKTSLLQAGLFPRLREQNFLPVLVRLDYKIEDPKVPALTAQVKALLAQALAMAAASDGEPNLQQNPRESSLWEYFHRRERRFVDAAGEPIAPVIVFDQFEEAFTQGLGRAAGRAGCQDFLGELADLIEHRPPAALRGRAEDNPDLIADYEFNRQSYRILISLREDYLPQLESLRTRAPSLGNNRLRLTRMGGSQAREAVLRPGQDLVTAEVADEIVRFVGVARVDDPFNRGDGDAGRAIEHLEVEPSLLSLFCRELNERRLARALPRITTDLFSGERNQILDDFYAHCIKGQPAAVGRFIEDNLVESGVRESPTEDRAKRILAEHGVTAADTLDHLVQRRLLHVEDRLGIRRIELIHDVLLEPVKRSKAAREARASARRFRWWLGGGGALLALLVAIFAALAYEATRRAQLAAVEQQEADQASQAIYEIKDCNALWVARNSIYKARGYCFRTPRAIAYFGNAGCIYQSESDVPLTKAERAQIYLILGRERLLACS